MRPVVLPMSLCAVGSVSGLAAGCEQVLGLVPPDAKFIPGHGPISTASDIRAFVQMVKDTRAVVEAEHMD